MGRVIRKNSEVNELRESLRPYRNEVLKNLIHWNKY